MPVLQSPPGPRRNSGTAEPRDGFRFRHALISCIFQLCMKASHSRRDFLAAAAVGGVVMVAPAACGVVQDPRGAQSPRNKKGVRTGMLPPMPVKED